MPLFRQGDEGSLHATRTNAHQRLGMTGGRARQHRSPAEIGLESTSHESSPCAWSSLRALFN